MKKKLSLNYHIVLALFFATMLTSLWPNNIYVLFVFSITSLILLPFNKWWDGPALAILAFSCLYCYNEYTMIGAGSGFVFISTMIAPVAFYRFGCWTLSWLQDESQRMKFLLIAILCYLIPLLLLTIEDMILVGVVNESRHMLSDIGKGDTTLSATLYGLMSSTGIGFISIFFIKSINLKQKLLYSSALIISILTVVHLVNRTGIALLIICVLFSIAYTTKFNPSKLISAALILTVILLVVFKSGIISQDVLSAYMERETHSTTNAAEFGGRLNKWEAALSDVMTHPFGYDRRGYTYAHNLLLDLAAIGGWLALFPFLAFAIKSIICFARVFRKRQTPYNLISMSVFLSMFCNAMVEPVIEGSLLFFVMFIMISGMLICLSKERS